MKILIVGGGGREHASAASVAKSKKAEKIYCAPGNAGIAQLAECVPIGAMEFDKLAAFAKEKEIDLAIIGMDDPLVGGLTDVLEDAGIRVFGHASRQSYRKSLKLYARDEYGEAEFDYPLFSDNIGKATGEVESAYKRLVLRNNGTDKAVTLFREELFQTLIGQIDGVDSKSVAPIAMYLNGEYYNCEWMQEVYDEVYMEANYGTSGDGYYEIVTVWDDTPDAELNRKEQQAKKDYKDLVTYASEDLTDDTVFEEFSSLVDVDNLLQRHRYLQNITLLML